MRKEPGVTAETSRDRLASRSDDLADVARRTGGRISIEAEPFRAQVSVRLDPSLARHAPFPLPLEPNTVTEEGGRSALWLGPDEWLVLGPAHGGGAIVAELEAALDGLHRSVVDVSANRTAVVLGGPDRLQLLAGGCPIDLHPRAWGAGMCAQTLFAKTQVILHERPAGTGLLVRPSFATYLVDRLIADLD
jgi:sarcosine oxidase subunit gamma